MVNKIWKTIKSTTENKNARDTTANARKYSLSFDR